MIIYYAGSQATECDECIINNNLSRLGSQLGDLKMLQVFMDAKKNTTYSGNIFIDSGAFTALTKGVEIDIDDYISKIDNCGEYITQFANLDIIPDKTRVSSFEESCRLGWQNFLHIQEKSKYKHKCAFVIHKNDPQDIVQTAIDYYKEHDYLKYIALGGLVGEPEDALQYCIKTCNTIKDALPDVKIHLFGYTRLRHLPHIRCDSTDSTTWLKVGATGQVLTAWGPVIVSGNQTGNPKHVCNFKDADKEPVLKEILSYGFTLEELGSEYRKRMLYNIMWLKNWQDNYKYIEPKKGLKRKLF